LSFPMPKTTSKILPMAIKVRTSLSPNSLWAVLPQPEAPTRSAEHPPMWKRAASNWPHLSSGRSRGTHSVWLLWKLRPANVLSSVGDLLQWMYFWPPLDWQEFWMVNWQESTDQILILDGHFEEEKFSFVRASK